MGFSRQECWSGLPFSSPVDHVLSELSIMTLPSWVALYSMAHCFIKSHKAGIMWSFWLVFCDCGFHSACPLIDEDKRSVQASWWSWTIMKAECQGIHAFKLWCWRKLLRVLWTARRSTSQSYINLNIHWKDWCWSWNSKTLATWWERLTARKEGGDRGWDDWMAPLIQWTWVWANSGR